jgi:hypothetical protein
VSYLIERNPVTTESDEQTGRVEVVDTSIGGLVEYVKTYAKQETLDPIKGAGRYLGFGAAGAVLVGLGGSLVLLGLLRLLQTEFDQRLARGALSWAAYAVVLVVAGLAIALAISRINKSSLQKKGSD